MSRLHSGAAGVIALTATMLLVSGCGGGGRSGGLQGPPGGPGGPLPPPSAVAVEVAFPSLPSFSQPLALLQAPGDSTRWFVVEKNGTVRVFDNDPSVSSSSLWLNISGQVSAAGEGGLLGLAFHSEFQTNGAFFVSYTTAGSFDSRISRWTVTPGTGMPDPNSEEIVLEVPQPQQQHNGGNLAFGPDGFLYAGFGDGGGSGDPFENGQDTTTLLGAILRLDVDGSPPYEIPADNPFAGNTECVIGSGTMACPELFAWGLRNPWRFSFDAQTGDLWIGDVGQNAWEEIDRATGGENFGWDEREGAHCFEPPNGCSTVNVDPITEYDHSVGQSVTGGYVYRGSDFPSLQGQYVFGDFVSGRIWRVPATATQGTPPVELADTALNISSFGVSNDGEIFVVAFGSGTLYRLVVP